MLTEIYIEALLVDEELADQVWEAWNAGDISDFVACWLWRWICDIKARQLAGVSPIFARLRS